MGGTGRYDELEKRVEELNAVLPPENITSVTHRPTGVTLSGQGPTGRRVTLDIEESVPGGANPSRERQGVPPVKEERAPQIVRPTGPNCG
jgi:hypothetical protein